MKRSLLDHALHQADRDLSAFLVSLPDDASRDMARVVIGAHVALAIVGGVVAGPMSETHMRACVVLASYVVSGADPDHDTPVVPGPDRAQ